MKFDELRELVRQIESARHARTYASVLRDPELKAIRVMEAELLERRLRERLSGISLGDLLGDLFLEPVADGLDRSGDVLAQGDRDRPQLIVKLEQIRDALGVIRDKLEQGRGDGVEHVDQVVGQVGHEGSSPVGGQALESPGLAEKTVEDGADGPSPGVGAGAAGPDPAAPVDKRGATS